MQIVYIIFIFTTVFTTAMGNITREDYAQWDKKYYEASHKCVNSTHLADRIISDFMNHPDKPADRPVDQHVKCYFLCVVQEFKWMNQNGDVTPNSDTIPHDMVEFGNKCKDVTGENACDKGWKFVDCFMKLMKNEMRGGN